MKRPGRPSRKSSLRSSPTSQPSRRTPMKQVNPERQAKRKVAQAAKHRAYMRSETRKFVDARAGGRCEASVMLLSGGVIGVSAIPSNRYRCENKALAHHHLTYARYGGNELPDDVLKVCQRCHDYLESQHPTRWLAHRSAGRTQETDHE